MLKEVILPIIEASLLGVNETLEAQAVTSKTQDGRENQKRSGDLQVRKAGFAQKSVSDYIQPSPR